MRAKDRGGLSVSERARDDCDIGCTRGGSRRRGPKVRGEKR